MSFKGLRNLGATCYFNPVIQILYSLPVIRETVLDYERFSSDNDKSGAVISGVECSQAEIIASLMFLEMLNELFNRLEQSQATVIIPDRNLFRIPATIMPQDDLSELQDFTDGFNSFIFFTRASLDPIEQAEDIDQDDIISRVFGFRQAMISRNGNRFYRSREQNFMMLHTIAGGGRTLESLLDQTCYNDDRHYSLFLELPQVLHIRVNHPLSRRNNQLNKPVDIPFVLYLDKYLSNNVHRVVPILERIAPLKIQLKRALQRRNLGYGITNEDLHAETISPDLQSLPTQDRININIQYDFALEEEIVYLQGEIEQAFDRFRSSAFDIHAIVCYRSEHFWAYIFEYDSGEWWLYDDSTVRVIAENNVFEMAAHFACNVFFINRAMRNNFS